MRATSRPKGPSQRAVALLRGRATTTHPRVVRVQDGDEPHWLLKDEPQERVAEVIWSHRSDDARGGAPLLMVDFITIRNASATLPR